MSHHNSDDEIVKKQLSWGAISFIEEPSSKILSLAVLSIAGACVLFVVFSFVFQIEVTVRANGQINALSGVKEAISAIDGVIESTEVEVGQLVKKDQILARLKINGSNEREIMELKESLQNRRSQLPNAPKLNIISTSIPDQVIRAQLIDIEKKVDLIKFLNGYRKTVFQSEIEPINKRLKVLESQRRAINSSKNRKYLLAQRNSVDEEIYRLKSQIANLENSVAVKLHEAIVAADESIEVAIVNLDLFIKTHQIRSPIDGTLVKSIVNPGSFVKAQSVVGMIIPSDAPMIAEVIVRPEDLPRVTSGAKVLFSIDAYPWHKFGYFKGEVQSIERLKSGWSAGDSSTMSGYLAKVKIQGPMDSRRPAALHPLIPGMKVESRIVWKRENLLILVKEHLFGDRS